jgi:hypothetical protein
MKSLSFFKTTTFFLLLLNLVLIFLLFQGRPKGPHGPRGPFKHKAIEILKLDATQAEEFKALAKTHHEAIEKLNTESSTLLKPYFNDLFKKTNSSEKDSLMLRFQSIAKEKVVVTQNHFLEVKKILKPEQEQHFDLFLKKSVNILLLDKKGPKKPR